MPARELIVPKGMENIYEEKGYAPGVKVGNMLYVSGMLGRDGDLNIIAETEAQFIQVFENMKSVLEAAGATFDDVVEFDGFFTALQRDFPIYQKVKDRYVTGNFPGQTAIGVTELSTPGLFLELKCSAVIPD